jgi:hypothetical protein
MIDTLTESAVPLTAATKLIPGRRAGKNCAVETLYRWSTNGCRGVVLETIQIGVTRCTTREALQRFFEALTAQSAGNSSPTPAPISRARRRDVERAERVLDAAGI